MITKQFSSPFGYLYPERDKREMCPFCKNEDTRRIVGLELMSFEEYHGENPFKAFECQACNGTFHYATQIPNKPISDTAV